MITPERFATIRRAARRAVRKYDVVKVVIGRDSDRIERDVDATRLVDY
jgi:hypothetical protein